MFQHYNRFNCEQAFSNISFIGHDNLASLRKRRPINSTTTKKYQPIYIHVYITIDINAYNHFFRIQNF